MSEHPAPPTPTQAANWEALYQAGTTGWERGVVNPALAGFLADGALRPGRILIPAAGRSPEPRVLADAGFEVTTVDISPTAVAAQRERLAGTSAHALLGDLFAFEPERPFDAVYDQACLCALPPTLVTAYAARLAGWLRPGGVLAALFLQRPPSDDPAAGPPFHCGLERMHALFPDLLWRWPEASTAPLAPRAQGFSDLPVALRRR